MLLSATEEPSCLLVGEVWGPSLVAEWNTRHSPEVWIRPGDRITSVNGIGCNPDLMLQECVSTGEHSVLRLHIE